MELFSTRVIAIEYGNRCFIILASVCQKPAIGCLLSEMNLVNADVVF